ncbi:MAG: cytochrome c biogenesis CcdA family protein [Methanobacterium paludis]|nr:cytochrome c biogenesis CcdA family protein [Methanobacterium paludis]
MNVSFLVSFSAGVVSVLSPCVLPLVPIVMGYSLKKELSQVISFIIGFFLVFAVITTLTVIFTVSIGYYLFYFRIAAALLIVGIGILFLINKNILKFSYMPHNGKNLGSFTVGFLTCLAWSPCYGPYIAAIAAYSAFTGSIIYTIINVALFALGFSFTLIIIGIFSSKLHLERVLKHSDEIRILSGVIICIAGFYLLLNLL